MEPPKEEEEKPEGEAEAETQSQGKVEEPRTKSAAAESAPGEPTEGEEEKEQDEPDEPPFEPNDYLQKAEMEPPRDPEGAMTMHPDLLIASTRIVEILENALQVCLTWIMAEKQLYE